MSGTWAQEETQKHRSTFWKKMSLLALSPFIFCYYWVEQMCLFYLNLDMGESLNAVTMTSQFTPGVSKRNSTGEMCLRLVFCFCTTGLKEDNCISKKIWHKSQVLGNRGSGSGSMSEFENNLPPQKVGREGGKRSHLLEELSMVLYTWRPWPWQIMSSSPECLEDHLKSVHQESHWQSWTQ